MIGYRLSSPSGANPIANRRDGVEVVVIDDAPDLACSLSLNYSEFPNSCGRIEFTVVANPFQVLICSRHGHLERFRDQPLRELAVGHS